MACDSTFSRFGHAVNLDRTSFLSHTQTTTRDRRWIRFDILCQKLATAQARSASFVLRTEKTKTQQKKRNKRTEMVQRRPFCTLSGITPCVPEMQRINETRLETATVGPNSDRAGTKSMGRSWDMKLANVSSFIVHCFVVDIFALRNFFTLIWLYWLRFISHLDLSLLDDK